MKISKALASAAFLFFVGNMLVFGGTEPRKNLKVDSKVKEFDLSEVTLLNGPFKEAQNRDIAWLKMLDMERLLVPFRKTAGIPVKVKEYGGWEDADVKFDGIRGHFMGHYLSALSKGYAVSNDKELKRRVDYLVTELSKCQKASKSAYIGAFPESLFDDLNAGKKVSWVPWYTMHKLFAGLYDVYNYTGNADVYAVLMQLTDWAKVKTESLDADAMQKVLQTEQGGMAEVLANIYAITQKPAHLALAKKFEHHLLLDNMKAGTDNLTGLHANTQIPKMIGAAREYEVTGEEPYRKASEFFWDGVMHRTTVTGGHSVQEHFKEPDVLAKYLSIPEQDETCNAYNMLQLTSHLYDWTGNIKYAEYTERTLINSILASQTTEKYENIPAGMMTYHQAVTPGYWKRFNDKENCFWCCTGTGSENHVQYGKFVYANDKDGLIVNQFVASQLFWANKFFTIKQETLFPEQESTKLTVISSDHPFKMKIRIRIPSWASASFSIKLNGRPYPVKALPGSYAEVEKVWVAKDMIEVSLPMSLHQEPMPDDKGIVAFMYGPMVLSGQLGKAGLTKEHLFASNGDQNYLKIDSISIPSFSGVGSDLSWIKPVIGKPFTFVIEGKGTPADVTLIPYYKQFFERYSIYWKVTP